ncbi:VPLPA-CTERM sorting domain-containing protein [Epibacterium ulvae]|uniref:VPLPA-CTERM sorting domain-containing protein n=1 Tax=Epibacterium ulvae TaxID=1156985 RepID=UPI001BFCD011|nr:VPLPA-CTERM sorting domain-containing protein [Epibacterium ulvae]MBT8153110.1 VPLPA-CTERM sorting domain-containing protein [Epibacterium ulvae]
MTLFGTSYTGENATDFPNFITFDFFAGVLRRIDYNLRDGVNGVDFSEQDFDQLIFAGGGGLLFDEAEGIFEVTASAIAFPSEAIAPVPVPAGLPLMATGLFALGWTGRKMRKQG